jgi:hypothetical protein
MSSDETVKESSWVACGPSRTLYIPLTPEPPTKVVPTRPTVVGRSTDPGFGEDVSRKHGELSATADGRVWYRDVSTGGTYFNDSTHRRLEFGEWVDVTDKELILGTVKPASNRVLQFRNLATLVPTSPPPTAPKKRPKGGAATKSDVNVTTVTPAQLKLLGQLERIPQPKATFVEVSNIVSTQVVPRGDVIRNPSWEAVAERLADAEDTLSSGYVLIVGDKKVALPINGKAVPFGSDARLADMGGVVLESNRVSRVHGFFRFNPFGGPANLDGTRAGSLEVYDGNGRGRPSTNHIFLQSPQQPIGIPIAPGAFRTFAADDQLTFADYHVKVIVDSAPPAKP